MLRPRPLLLAVAASTLGLCVSVAPLAAVSCVHDDNPSKPTRTSCFHIMKAACPHSPPLATGLFQIQLGVEPMSTEQLRDTCARFCHRFVVRHELGE